MFRKIISLYKIWKLKREILTIQAEIDDFYLNISSRNDRFQTGVDVDKLYQRFINLRNVEVRELNRQIKELKK
jgi:hypothetical protein